MTDQLSDARLSVGGNQPREIDLLRERADELAAMDKEWSKVNEIASEEIERRAVDFKNQTIKFLQRVKTEKAHAERPIKDDLDQVRATYVEVAAPVEAAKAHMTAMLTAWLVKKEQAEPEVRPQAKGHYSPRAVALVKQWKAEVEDISLAFVHYMDRAEVRELLTRLGSAEARAGAREIPGYRIYSEETAR